MKLKFRADPKDWFLFILLTIFVLIVSALIVLNLGTFADIGIMHGFNPFPAFTPDYFGPTMVVFIGIMVTIIGASSSLIFDREKGFGVSSNSKKESGYSKWLSEKEFRKQLVRINPSDEKTNAGGIPLIMNKKGVWVDNGGYHNLIIGSTGAGKTQATVFPMVKNLCKHDESMIITDPKGELYEGTAELLKANGYNVVLLNFRDPQQGNSWNPLSLPYNLYKEGNQDKATELLDDLALNILYDASNKGQDPFWEKTSADYFAGLSQALFEDTTEDEINLNSINLMSTSGEDKFMGSTYIKQYFESKDPTSAAYINASATITAPTETKGSILSVFRGKIKLFATKENLSEMLAHNDFDMKDIGRKKTAVFIVIQDEKKTYHSLVTIFLKQCYETLVSVAQECGGKLPHRTNFILDEFANMPALSDVTTMVSAARSRNIRFSFIIQNFAQLYEVYGKENGETIKGNCGNIVYLISSELSALEEISKMCGEVKSKEKDKTSSTPLVTVSDLQRLPEWNMIVLRIRNFPFKTTLIPNFKMDWGKTYPKATYPIREKKPVKKFDLKKYVEDMKNEKMRDLLGPSALAPAAPMFDMKKPLEHSPSSFNTKSQNQVGTNTMTPNPFAPSFAQPRKDSSEFDVDELIKRIDAKIAELEEEERQEQLKESSKQSNEILKAEPILNKPAAKVEPLINKVPIIEEPKMELPKVELPKVELPKVEVPKVELPKEEPIKVEMPKVEIPNIIENPDITDDQFFDDFFDEE